MREDFHVWTHPHGLIDGGSSDYIPECKCLDSANCIASRRAAEPTTRSLQSELCNGPSGVAVGNAGELLLSAESSKVME